jgi:hypothetical protein
MADYGTIEGIAKYVRHMTVNGGFGPTTKPSIDEVGEMLDESCALLNGWLANYDYSVPLTATRAVAVMARYANLGAAGLAELSQRSGGYSETDENRRENKFLAEFYKAEAFIASGALLGLGETTTAAAPELHGFMVGGRTSGGQAVRPIFRRTMFGNDPAAENDGVKEADYSTEV